jgi:hypothetical protein
MPSPAKQVGKILNTAFYDEQLLGFKIAYCYKTTLWFIQNL